MAEYYYSNIDLNLEEVINDLEDKIKNNGKPIPFEELDESDKRYWAYVNKKDIYMFDQNKLKEMYNEKPLFYAKYFDETIEQFKKDIELFKEASNRFKKLDDFVSGEINQNDYLK